MDVDQDYESSRWTATMDPDSAASEAEQPAESDRSREEMMDEKAQNYGERRRLVSNEDF